VASCSRRVRLHKGSLNPFPQRGQFTRSTSFTPHRSPPDPRRAPRRRHRWTRPARATTGSSRSTRSRSNAGPARRPVSSRRRGHGHLDHGLQPIVGECNRRPGHFSRRVVVEGKLTPQLGDVLLWRVRAGELAERRHDVEMNEALRPGDSSVVIVGGHGAAKLASGSGSGKEPSTGRGRRRWLLVLALCQPRASNRPTMAPRQ
jgi:hypothetical protein